MTSGDFPVITGFPDDYNRGHFAFIGRTGSGKTYYAKYVIKSLIETMPTLPDGRPPVFVFVGKISSHDWLDPEPGGYPLVPAENVTTEWIEDFRTKMLHDLDITKRGLVVFDDFKSAMNYHTDTSFTEMFRVLRHLNTQLLVIAHAANDIPPVARSGVTHVIIAPTTNMNLMRELATSYLAGDTTALRAAFTQIASAASRGERPMLKLNTVTGTRSIHTAPPPAVSGVTTSALGAEATDTVAIAAHGVSGGIGMRSTRVDGTYNDASHNVQNVVVDTSIAATVAQNRVSLMAARDRAELTRSLELEGVRHEAIVRRARDRETLRGLLLSPFLSAEDRDTAASILARELGDSTITSYNLWERRADVTFMTSFYPDVPYRPRNPTSAAISTYAPLAMAAAKSDHTTLVGESLRAIGSGGISRALALIGVDTPADASVPTPGAAARERVRRWVVFRDRGGDGRWFSSAGDRAELMSALRACMVNPASVTRENVIEKTLNMLKKYYPADYLSEMENIRAVTRRRLRG